jgi:short-subunit dehydrogenase
MKTVIITGASRGLGDALAWEFHCSPDYSNIICHSRINDCPCENDFEGEYIKGDLLQPDTIAKLAQHDVDILINNVGICIKKQFEELSVDEIRKIIDTNLMAPIILTKALWPTLTKNKGLIININSIAGKNGSKDETAYCASKFGLRGFSQAIQFEAVKAGIKVVDVFLGGMQTDMTKGRDNFDKLIDPQEAAKVIFGLCNNYETLRITELEICRSNY